MNKGLKGMSSCTVIKIMCDMTYFLKVHLLTDIYICGLKVAPIITQH